MGNQQGKGNAKTPFTADELKILEATFRTISGHSDKVGAEKLLKAWSGNIDDHLAKCTVKYLFASGQQQLAVITVQRFAEPYYIVERGTTDEKLNFLAGSVHKSDGNQFAMKELENYVTSVFKSYLQIQLLQNDAHFECWKRHGYLTAERSILQFAKGQIRSLAHDYEHFVQLDKLEHWLQVNPTFLLIWKEVFAYLYSKYAGKGHKLGHNAAATNILPANEGLEQFGNYTPILDVPHIIFVNSNLPNSQRHKWRFLFSSKIMGESFSTMLGKILNRGPTLFVIEDEDHYIFGGYAPESWSMKPAFGGDDTSMLFTFSPVMRCFNATGYNDHYQYLNLGQQTMPNGLGMGGQFNFWGLWLDSEYGLGQSAETCTTYRDYVQLSKRKEFKIRNVEVWGIGDLPRETDESDDDGDAHSTNKRSVLDKNLEDRVMLELSGKKMHSDGLREPDMDL